MLIIKIAFNTVDNLIRKPQPTKTVRRSDEKKRSPMDRQIIEPCSGLQCFSSMEMPRLLFRRLFALKNFLYVFGGFLVSACRSDYGFAKAVLISACGSLRFIKQTLYSTGRLIINLLNFSLSPFLLHNFFAFRGHNSILLQIHSLSECIAFLFRAFFLFFVDRTSKRAQFGPQINYFPSQLGPFDVQNANADFCRAETQT